MQRHTSLPLMPILWNSHNICSASVNRYLRQSLRYWDSIVGFSQRYLLGRMTESHKMACESENNAKNEGKTDFNGVEMMQLVNSVQWSEVRRDGAKKHIYVRLSVFALMRGCCRSGWWNFPICSTAELSSWIIPERTVPLQRLWWSIQRGVCSRRKTLAGQETAPCRDNTQHRACEDVGRLLKM